MRFNREKFSKLYSNEDFPRGSRLHFVVLYTQSVVSIVMLGRRKSDMATIEKSIEVNVPVRTAYNQWTQFEEFPHFMEGVQNVKQLDDKRLHWHAKVAGTEEQWDATITEQTPDRMVAWRSTSGA